MGKGHSTFALDTGGIISLIRLNLARQLRLPEVRQVTLGLARGVGQFPLFQVHELTFGGVLRQPNVALAGTDRIRFGEDVSGSLAAGVLTAVDSELDFPAQRWRVYHGGGPVREGWISHERAIVERGPRGGSAYLFGTGRIGDRALRVLLDTGAPTPIGLFEDFARRNGVYVEQQNWTPAGMRGDEPERMVRSKLPLEIGGLRLERPLVAIRSKRSPGGTLENGIVGLPVIQRMNVATEVNRRLLWTRPNGMPAEEERYNMSGLWVSRRGNDLFAGAVGRGSPAEAVGIVPGDRIAGADFDSLIERLNGCPRDKVAFSVVRGDVRREVTIELRPYL
jgi:hypothetical protein